MTLKVKGGDLRYLDKDRGKPENKPRYRMMQNRMGESLGISRLVIAPTRPFFAV